MAKTKLQPLPPLGQTETATAASALFKENPLITSLRLPGETFQLPSKALLYKNNEVSKRVLESDGEVHVFPLTTYEELLLKTPDLLFSGQAIVQTFSRCIPDILNPMQLLSKDVDFLLVALRKVTYGVEAEITYDHECDNSKEHKYIINTKQFFDSTKSLDVTEEIEQGWPITLSNGQTAIIRPFLQQHVVESAQRTMTFPDVGEMTSLEFVESIRTTIIENLAPAIAEVDGISDPELIKEWIDTIPTVWVTELSEAIERVSDFGISFDAEVKCKDCGATVTVKVPLNPQSFFTKPSVEGRKSK